MLYFDPHSSMEQDFNVPLNVINFLIENPANVYFWKTMLKSCKYVYINNPLIPSGDQTSYDETENGGVIVVQNLTNSIEKIPVKFITAGIWLIGHLDVYGGLVNLMNVVAKSDLSEITIHSGAIVFVEDVLAIGLRIDRLNFENIVVLNDDESTISDDRFTTQLMELENCQMVISYRTNNNNNDYFN